MNSHNQVNIERLILSSYLQLDLTPDVFKRDCRKRLDINIFIMPFHKRIAERINKSIQDNDPLPYLLCLLQDKIVGTNYENDLLLIEATTPISNDCGLDWYINYLVQNKIEREFNHE